MNAHIDTSEASVTIRPANYGGTRWEVDISNLYINDDTAAHAVETLLTALGGRT